MAEKKVELPASASWLCNPKNVRASKRGVRGTQKERREKPQINKDSIRFYFLFEGGKKKFLSTSVRRIEKKQRSGLGERESHARVSDFLGLSLVTAEQTVPKEGMSVDRHMQLLNEEYM